MPNSSPQIDQGACKGEVSLGSRTLGYLPYYLVQVVRIVEVAVGTTIAGRPRTDPHERSLAHVALISDV